MYLWTILFFVPGFKSSLYKLSSNDYTLTKIITDPKGGGNDLHKN